MINKNVRFIKEEEEVVGTWDHARYLNGLISYLPSLQSFPHYTLSGTAQPLVSPTRCFFRFLSQICLLLSAARCLCCDYSLNSAILTLLSLQAFFLPLLVSVARSGR